MKKSASHLIFTLILFCIMAFAQTSHAQESPPPPGDKGSGTNQAPGNGGGAPIDGGVLVSLALVAGYAGWKLFRVGKVTRNA